MNYSDIYQVSSGGIYWTGKKRCKRGETVTLHCKLRASENLILISYMESHALSNQIRN
jgi:hypothetical protein